MGVVGEGGRGGCGWCGWNAMTTFAHPSTSHHPQGEAKAPAKVGEGRGSTHMGGRGRGRAGRETGRRVMCRVEDHRCAGPATSGAPPQLVRWLSVLVPIPCSALRALDSSLTLIILVSSCPPSRSSWVHSSPLPPTTTANTTHHSSPSYLP